MCVQGQGVYTSVCAITHALVSICKWKTQDDIRCLPRLLYNIYLFVICFYMYEGFIWISVSHVNAWCWWMPYNWSYKWLWVAIRVLGWGWGGHSCFFQEQQPLLTPEPSLQPPGLTFNILLTQPILPSWVGQLPNVNFTSPCSWYLLYCSCFLSPSLTGSFFGVGLEITM